MAGPLRQTLQVAARRTQHNSAPVVVALRMQHNSAPVVAALRMQLSLAPAVVALPEELSWERAEGLLQVVAAHRMPLL
jgi:hypothetical protein